MITKKIKRILKNIGKFSHSKNYMKENYQRFFRNYVTAYIHIRMLFSIKNSNAIPIGIARYSLF